MKYMEVILNQLKNQPYFGKMDVINLGAAYNTKKTTAEAYISRALKRRAIIKLKNGLYAHADFYDKNKGDASYLFYLANIIRTPSYVSSWAALQYYNFTTEDVYPITSVTTKVTRTYDTRIGSFSYQSIQKSLFANFSLVKEKFHFFMASPAKALFDMLYFRTRDFHDLRLGDINALIYDLRIDIDEMTAAEREKFYAMVKPRLTHE